MMWPQLQKKDVRVSDKAKLIPAQPKILQRLSSVEDTGPEKRFSTGIGGLDACLAESEEAEQGIPAGTSILISGMPGSGKSTIATIMAAMNIGVEGQSADTLYMHGEEPARRVKGRWDRFKLQADPFLYDLRATEDALMVIRDLQQTTPRLVTIVDSVQKLSLGGKRRPENQSEGAEMIAGQVCSAGGLVVLINHVDKSGTMHAGAGDLPHNVDIHLHVTINAKKGERFLEVRKNRTGRAGFQVPLNLGISSVTIGTPAPLSSAGAMASARNNLERAQFACMELLLEGEFVSGYDMVAVSEKAGMQINGGMVRAGLEMAYQTLVREKEIDANGNEMPKWILHEEKRKGRKGYYMENAPNKPKPGTPPKTENGSFNVLKDIKENGIDSLIELDLDKEKQ